MKIMITILLRVRCAPLLPPYQKAGYATDEPLQKKICELPLGLCPPQSNTASGAPVNHLEFFTSTAWNGPVLCL